MSITLKSICAVLLGMAVLFTGCTEQKGESSQTSQQITSSSTPTLPPIIENSGHGSVSMHYLGHSTFILEFDNHFSLLVDYGVGVPGWDNPVNQLNDFQPHVVIHSHTNHSDHYLKKDWGSAQIVTEECDFELNGLRIKSIPTSETSLSENDNNGFLFTYKELKILYLGEPLIYILNIEDEKVKKRIREMYPDTYDLIIIPLSGRSITIEQVKQFIDVLKPKRVAAVHYAGKEVLWNFLSLIEEKAKKEGKHYRVERIDGPRYSFSATDEAYITTIVKLKPAPYSPSTLFRIKFNVW